MPGLTEIQALVLDSCRVLPAEFDLSTACHAVFGNNQMRNRDRTAKALMFLKTNGFVDRIYNETTKAYTYTCRPKALLTKTTKHAG